MLCVVLTEASSVQNPCTVPRKRLDLLFDLRDEPLSCSAPYFPEDEFELLKSGLFVCDFVSGGLPGSRQRRGSPCHLGLSLAWTSDRGRFPVYPFRYPDGGQVVACSNRSIRDAPLEGRDWDPVASA